MNKLENHSWGIYQHGPTTAAQVRENRIFLRGFTLETYCLNAPISIIRGHGQDQIFAEVPIRTHSLGGVPFCGNTDLAFLITYSHSCCGGTLGVVSLRCYEAGVHIVLRYPCSLGRVNLGLHCICRGVNTERQVSRDKTWKTLSPSCGCVLPCS